MTPTLPLGHEPFGSESLDLELETERLKAELLKVELLKVEWRLRVIDQNNSLLSIKMSFSHIQFLRRRFSTSSWAH